MNYGIVSCVPILILILGVLIVKKIAPMMVLASFVGAVLIYRGGFFSGYISMIYAVLSDPTYQFVLILLMLFGAMIRMFQKSGALSGLRELLSSAVSGPRQPLLLSALLSLLLFIDDYLSLLAVPFALRDVTDRNGIPREHLAYQVTTVSPCFGVLIPATSWTAFTIGLISRQGLGFSDYVRAIPMMYFPILMLATGLLLALGILPKVGALKASYARVQAGRGVLPGEEEEGETIVDMEEAESAAIGPVWNFILPVMTLIAFVLLFDHSLVHGLIGALAAQAILYTLQRRVSPQRFVAECFEGAKSMSPMALLLFFAFLLNHANQTMGFTEYLIGQLGDAFAPQLLPMLVFLLIGGVTFVTSGYWIIQVITVPLFLPLAFSMGVNPSLVLAAIMSGAVFGSMFCFYSDVLILAAAGTGVPNMRQIQVSAPYILTCAALASLAFAVSGFLF